MSNTKVKTMKKVVTVHIANEVFQMEEDGYAKIQKVLKKIETGSGKGPTIAHGIEERIGMALKEIASAERLITCEQVDDVLESMGFMPYLKENPYQNQYQTYHSGYKKLYRHPNDKVIGGVCGGIAAYLNTDPIIIRVLFIVLFGLMFIPYLVMCIVIPMASTPEQINDLHNQSF